MELLEIRRNVGARLDIPDLTACVRVSKLWNDTFIPFLYTKAAPTHYRSHWLSFEPRLPLLHDLEISLSTTKSELKSFVLNCTHLKRLEIAFKSTKETADSCLQLLEGNPQLTQFVVTEMDRAVGSPTLLLESLDRCCPRVTNLGLVSIPSDNQPWGQILVRTQCSRLTVLELEWRGATLNVGEWTGAIQEDSWPGFPELRELVVSVPRDRSCWPDLLLLFKRAPILESISWQLNHPPRLSHPIKRFVNTLCGVLRGQDDGRNPGQAISPWWPRLYSIRLSENLAFAKSSFKDAILAQILSSVPTNLRKLSLPRAVFGTLAWRTLQTHLASLEVLELDAPSWMIQEFLTSCPNLKELRVKKFEAFEAVHGFGADRMRNNEVSGQVKTVGSTMRVRALLRRQGELEVLYGEGEEPLEYHHALPTIYPQPRPWVCRRLQVLKIGFTRMMEKEANDQVFWQLAELRDLRELNLCLFRSSRCGLDPRISLGMDPSSHPFRGEYQNVTTMKREAVGQRLLEIWPKLDSCNWML